MDRPLRADRDTGPPQEHDQEHQGNYHGNELPHTKFLRKVLQGTHGNVPIRLQEVLTIPLKGCLALRYRLLFHKAPLATAAWQMDQR